MPTKISYQTWSGGEGFNDPVMLIGYCKEEPFEVLKQVILTHDIYHYLDLYRPIDYDYPNNVMGLIIQDFNEKGLKVISNINELDLSRAVTQHKRTKDTILNSLQLCKRWHTYSTNTNHQSECWKLINEIESHVNTMLK